jgi:hypothetical protein
MIVAQASYQFFILSQYAADEFTNWTSSINADDVTL